MDELEQIETKIAYLEDFVQKLQGATVKQGKKIERLERENAALKSRVKELAAFAENSSQIPNERPPHY